MFGSITLKQFTKEDTNFLKGVAILLIVFHNFFRAVNPITGENEFWFSAQYYRDFISAIISNPINIVNAFFNFLGHYGVQAFIVISAYGLTLSWLKNKPNYWQFLLNRFLKLYPVFFIVALLYIVVVIFTSGNLPSNSKLVDLGYQLSLFANIIPNKALVITGPWWFFSFIFQFYIVFPFIILIANKYGNKSLLVIAVIGILLTVLLYKPMRGADLNPFFLFIGHLPEFCLGIFLAIKKEYRIPIWLFMLFVFMLIAGNVIKYAWPFANISAAIILIVFIQWLIRKKQSFVTASGWLVGLGSISMYLFACHGFLRSNFINLANSIDSTIVSILLAIIFFIFSIGVSLMVMNAEGHIRDFILKPPTLNSKLFRLSIILILIFTFIGTIYFQNQNILANQ